MHEKDGSPIGYEKVCKKEGKEVPADEIVKAYEVADGELVYLDDDDFAAAEEEGYRTIQVLDFVDRDDIDPIVFQRSYYLGPGEGADKVYLLLMRAMEESGLVGHRRVRVPPEAAARLPACARRSDRARGDVLRGRDPSGQGHRAEAELQVDKKELEMAQTLIDRFTSDFDHGKYEDQYRKRLLKIVKQKRRGRKGARGASRA